jgi:uracil-DNA glycosylase family 4
MSRRRTLAGLNRQIVSCRLCPRLVEYRERIARERRRAFHDQVYWGRPVPSGGDPHARVLLVGLAPGAHGSNRTGRMFTGDGSGDFLTLALFRTGFANQPDSVSHDDGLRLHDLYITAAAHCAPPGNKPSRGELENCRPFLADHLALLESVRVIVALGKIAFDNLLATLAEQGYEIPSPRPPFSHGAEVHLGRHAVLATYHPSRQNTQTGRLTPKMLDTVLRRARALARA